MFDRNDGFDDQRHPGDYHHYSFQEDGKEDEELNESEYSFNGGTINTWGDLKQVDTLGT